MIRTFQTHRIRRQQELTERLWQFTALSGENAGKSFPVATPSCWETYPGFELYRSEGKYETTFCAGGDLRIECKGVVDEYRRPKLCYETVKRIFECDRQTHETARK